MRVLCFKTQKLIFKLFFSLVVDNWTTEELSEAYESLYTPGHKTSVFYKDDSYGNFIRDTLNRIDPPKLLPERFSLEAQVFAFKPQHFLYRVFDRKLQQYIDAGLINSHLWLFKRNNNPSSYSQFKESFAVLTLSELEAGFVICFLPLVFSLFVFCIEWMPTLKNLVVFLFIFRTYFKLKWFDQKKLFAC